MLALGPASRRSFFFSSRRRHTRYIGDWSSDVCSSDLDSGLARHTAHQERACRRGGGGRQIGRASCRKECRSRWAPYNEKKKDKNERRARKISKTDIIRDTDTVTEQGPSCRDWMQRSRI